MSTTDFEMFEHNDKVIEFTVRDDDGNPVDITDAQIKWQMAQTSWPRTTPLPVVLTKTNDSGGDIDIVDAGHGIFEVHLLNTDTTDLGGHTYYHEARVILPGDIFETVLTGKIKIKKALMQA